MPDLVALRRAVFRFSERPTDAELAPYLEQMFWANPWRDDELPSLVYEDGRGRVGGFLGVIPRPMVFRGEPLRAAVATQLMVAPEYRGLVGLRLVRAFRSGLQDVSLSDAANDAARRLWQSVGGVVAVAHSVEWERPLRPRWVSALPRPLAAAVGKTLPNPSERARLDGCATGPLDAATMAAAAPQLLRDYTLRPRYEDGTFGWLLGQLAQKRQFGGLEGALVRMGHTVAGWFLYCLDGNGHGEVVQVVSRAADRSLVVAHLFDHARRRGARSLAGRLAPEFLPALAALRCRLRPGAPWVLVDAARPEVLLAIAHGAAFLSRLDAEWWLSF